jgi:hypothetical protein
LSCFLGGLKDEIRLPVRMFNPKTLVDAYSLARMQEECILTTRRYPRSMAYSSQFQHPNHGLSVQLPVGFTKETPFQGNTRNNFQGQTRLNVTAPPRGGLVGKDRPKPNQGTIPIQRISQAQMEERRRKGLCYTCDSKRTRGHVCTVPKLFVIDVWQDGDIEKNKGSGPAKDDPGDFFLEEFPEISLNAITGTPSPKTMQIVVYFRFQPVVILIDSDSTHNFVDTKLATTLGIRPILQDGIRVQVANGEEVPSPGRCKDIEVKM